MDSLLCLAPCTPLGNYMAFNSIEWIRATAILGLVVLVLVVAFNSIEWIRSETLWRDGRGDQGQLSIPLNGFSG